ncbi:MAG: hypothetical protein Q9185_006411 [Variospora sp. 1 TL-2023]
MRRRKTHSALSAAAPVFVPRQRPYEGLPRQPGKHPSPRSTTWSTSTSPPSRPIYDNEVPQVPTHWVPIYGAGHGIFYDPVTKLFYNDGPPRPTFERADGTVQPMDNSPTIPRIGFRSEDILHLQPPSLTEPIIKSMEVDPNAIRRYYCRCRGAWLEAVHECPPPDGEQAADAPLLGPMLLPFEAAAAAPSAIRPGQRIPPESFTHDLVVGDVSYLARQQRYYYGGGGGLQVPMPMPGVNGFNSLPRWIVACEGQQTRMRVGSDGSGWAEEYPGGGKDESSSARIRRRGSVKGKWVPLRGKTTRNRASNGWAMS